MKVWRISAPVGLIEVIRTPLQFGFVQNSQTVIITHELYQAARAYDGEVKSTGSRNVRGFDRVWPFLSLAVFSMLATAISGGETVQVVKQANFTGFPYLRHFRVPRSACDFHAPIKI